jgi:hypothetical protein
MYCLFICLQLLVSDRYREVPTTLGIFKNLTSKTLGSSQRESKASDP